MLLSGLPSILHITILPTTGNFDDKPDLGLELLNSKQKEEYVNLLASQGDLSLPMNIPSTSTICSSLADAITRKDLGQISSLLTPGFLLSIPNMDLPFAGLYTGTRGIRSMMNRVSHFVQLRSVSASVVGSSDTRDSCVLRLTFSGCFLGECCTSEDCRRSAIDPPLPSRDFTNLEFTAVMRSSLGRFVAAGIFGGLHPKALGQAQRAGSALAHALRFTRAMHAFGAGSDEVRALVAPNAQFSMEFPGRDPLVFTGPRSHEDFLESLAVTQAYIGWESESLPFVRGARSQECRTIFAGERLVATGCVVEGVKTRKTMLRAVPTYSETEFDDQGRVLSSRLQILVNLSLHDIGSRAEIEEECADLTKECPLHHRLREGRERRRARRDRESRRTEISEPGVMSRSPPRSSVDTSPAPSHPDNNLRHNVYDNSDDKYYDDDEDDDDEDAEDDYNRERDRRRSARECRHNDCSRASRASHASRVSRSAETRASAYPGSSSSTSNNNNTSYANGTGRTCSPSISLVGSSSGIPSAHTGASATSASGSKPGTTSTSSSIPSSSLPSSTSGSVSSSSGRDFSPRTPVRASAPTSTPAPTSISATSSSTNYRPSTASTDSSRVTRSSTIDAPSRGASVRFIDELTGMGPAMHTTGEGRDNSETIPHRYNGELPNASSTASTASITASTASPTTAHTLEPDLPSVI